MDCPRCDATLEPRTVEGIDVHVCTGCTGSLVPMNRLVPLLEAMTRPLVHVVDPDAPIEALPDDGTRMPCPHCRRTMEPFGYMGMNTVIVDRCSADGVVWADAGELGTMSLLYARTNKRTADSYAKNRAIREGLARSTHHQLSGRAASRQVATSMLMGTGHMGAGYGSIGAIVDLFLGRDRD